MCTHKITVRNPTKSFKEGSSKHLLKVPCGHCDECQMNLAKEWSVRYWSEIQRYRNAGGKVAFVTFTYNSRNLPVIRTWIDEPVKVPHPNPELSTVGYIPREVFIPAFNHDHVKKYNDTVRMYFYQKYGFTSDGNKRTAIHNNKGKELIQTVLPFKFAWHCEFGTKRTERSHYHTLFFLPPEWCNTPELRSENAAKHFFRERWKYGFTFYSPEYGLWVNSEFAADYVSKYCFKDHHWYNQSAVHSFLFDENDCLIPDRLDQIKSFRPSHWNSKGMGIDLVELYDDYDRFMNGVNFQFLKNLRKGISINTKAPKYIVRKLLFDQTPDGRFILNDKGCDWKARSLPDEVIKDVLHMTEDFSPSGIEKLVDTEFIQKKFKHLGIDNAFQLSAYITRILGNRTLEEVSYYRKCWQGSFVRATWSPVKKYHDFFRYLDSLDLESFIACSIDKYKSYLYANRDPDLFSNTKGVFSKNEIPVIGFDTSPDSFRYFAECRRFEGFEYILEIQDILRTEFVRKYTIDYNRDRVIRQSVKLEKFKVS